MTEWRNVGCMTIPKEVREEDLAIAIYDILQEAPGSIGYACAIMGHPDLGHGLCRCKGGHT
jgi:hypothetical protein